MFSKRFIFIFLFHYADANPRYELHGFSTTQALFRAETWMDLDCADQVENHLIIPWAEYG
jgi:hypothetical protein